MTTGAISRAGFFVAETFVLHRHNLACKHDHYHSNPKDCVMLEDAYDVAVIGAGVFGAWTADRLLRAGAKVVLLDGYGPANNHASSGGESRIIRMSYGPDELYTRSAVRSLKLWHDLFKDIQ